MLAFGTVCTSSKFAAHVLGTSSGRNRHAMRIFANHSRGRYPSSRKTTACAPPRAHGIVRIEPAAEGRTLIQLKKVLDNRWALAAILVVFLFANLPLQRRVWALVAAYRPVSNT